MKNEFIAAQFELLADLLEIQGANPFRIRAYRNAARTISSTADALSDMVRDSQDLTQFDGIGKDLARQIAEIVTPDSIQRSNNCERKSRVVCWTCCAFPELVRRRSPCSSMNSG